ncbi:phospholipase effector Tle1 domain-containing protein [Erwinia sp. ErVv1]|uniref:phospholipase effector Tle1 domain-containing protein n=1 Tax=Erwinia sp. ErVv1 TaxID=1603299 RepID=UPI0035129708
MGLLKLYIGDKTTPCPKCGEVGVIVDGDHRCSNSAAVAVDGAEIRCGCPQGTNFLIAPGTIPQLSEAKARMAPVVAPEPEQHAQAAKKKKREITLTIGVFFDGTGHNAVNTQNMLKACTAGHYNLDDPEAESILAKCARENFGVSGSGATSYTGYYTNIHWLSTLYSRRFNEDSPDVQRAIYIDGIGTDAGKPDSKLGQGFGISDTGVVAKTDKAVSMLADSIQAALDAVSNKQTDYTFIIRSLQFDIFGFSRGAAAARHFANRIQSEDPAIISAIRQAMTGKTFNGSPAGRTRFIGIFDTVAAIGTPVNGLNPHSADTGDVKLTLRPGVAEKVFHITAANECRFNFALNSVKPAWPELALPGVHSDIGGGYLPVTKEDLFLTRPATETVPYSQPGEKTQAYRQAVAQLQTLDKSPCLAPLLRTNEISAETWYDDRLPPDRYGQMQKRSYAALTLRGRTVGNDWSRVALRVMLEAAQEAGVVFDPILSKDKELAIPDDLAPLWDKALAMGKAVRSGPTPQAFSQDELDVIAEKYIHCSANWNAIVVNTDGFIHGGASPSELIGFINRPDEQWKRSVYSMDGKKV